MRGRRVQGHCLYTGVLEHPPITQPGRWRPQNKRYQGCSISPRQKVDTSILQVKICVGRQNKTKQKKTWRPGNRCPSAMLAKGGCTGGRPKQHTSLFFPFLLHGVTRLIAKSHPQPGGSCSLDLLTYISISFGHTQKHTSLTSSFIQGDIS